ncbi:unnamed protein product [Orchesella dallaii]|uniref:LITAF domain-containing protein n=1 Tax=Orchesella dallaii TaxID=48710 RepID=A0ABP1RZD4_9HEXA
MAASAPPYQGYPIQPQLYPPLFKENDDVSPSAPPPPSYTPYSQEQQHHLQFQSQVMVSVPAPELGSHKVRMICRYCQSDIETRTDKKASIVAWISSGVMCFFGLFCGCCLIPFCIGPCQDTWHSCPKCGAHLGTNRAF